MTADQLAAAVTDLGLRYTRSQVTNLEAGRRDSITTGELSVLSAALGVPRLLLEFPLGRVDVVEALPGVEVSPLVALDWTETGAIRAWHADAAGVKRSSHDDAHLIRRYRRHRELIGAWEMAEGRAMYWRRHRGAPDEAADALARIEDEQRERVEALRELRALLRKDDLTPPELPESFSSLALRQALGEDDEL